MCDEFVEYLVIRGHARSRTQLEIQRAINVQRNIQQLISNINSGFDITMQYHPELPNIMGTIYLSLRFF